MGARNVESCGWGVSRGVCLRQERGVLLDCAPSTSVCHGLFSVIAGQWVERLGDGNEHCSGEAEE